MILKNTKKVELNPLLILLFLSITFIGYTQNNFEFSKSRKDSIRFQSYVLIAIDTVAIDNLNEIANINAPLAFEFGTNNSVNQVFLERYLKNKKELVLITDQNIDTLITNNVSVIQIDPKEIETYHIDFNKDSLVERHSLKEFVKISFEAGHEPMKRVLLNQWMQLGKQPNFIASGGISLAEVDSLVLYLNAFEKIFGIVKTENGQIINDVKFKGHEQTRVYGNFSLPVLDHENLPILVPYKSGYHFSPDIIYATPGNLKNSKDFKAIQMDLEFGMSDHFVFDPSFKNRIKENNEEILLNNVKIVEDSLRGKVGFFNNGSYIDTGIESKISLQKSFTITAWIKPTELGFNNSIIGKGKDFVVKLHKGFLTFTMAEVKDYISKVSAIPLNQWTYITIVHSNIDDKLSFYVNGKLTEEITLISEYVPSGYNILIGSNLWEEFFAGYLSDIKIWDRELNGNEIAILFEKGDEKALEKPFKMGVIIICGFFLVGIFLFLFKRKSKKKLGLVLKQEPQTKNANTLSAGREKQYGLERILCLGKLRILDKEGQDMAEKLSPLLKKIFVIVFLYSHQEGKKGISTNQLTEILWPGMSAQKAKNTRGTNINNLRAVLNTCSGINLVFKNKAWFIEISQNCFCDIMLVNYYFDNFSNDALSVMELENELPELLNLLKEGPLFSNLSEPWLDPFIDKFSNQVVEKCLDFMEILDIEKQGSLILLLAEVICIYDDLNEKAHRVKLQVLIQQGKLSLASKTHDNYLKHYFQIYKEPYPVSFEEMSSK